MRIVVRERRALLFLCMLAAMVLAWQTIMAVGAARTQRTAASYVLVALYAVPALCALFLSLSCAVRRLVLHEDACCYTTWYGRTRSFALSDIHQMQTMVASGCASFALLDHWGERLAQVEMHMAGAIAAYIWICEREVEVDELPHWISNSTYDEWDASAWHPDMPWKIRHRDTLRRMNWMFGWAMLGLGVAAKLLMPTMLRSIIFFFGPILVCLPYLVIPKTLLSDNPPRWEEPDEKQWGRRYRMSMFTPHFFLVALASYDILRINLTDWTQCVKPCLVFFAVLAAIYALRVLPHSRNKSEAPAVLILLGFFMMNAAHHANCLLTFEPPVHTELRVTGGYTRRSGYGRSRHTNHYLRVREGSSLHDSIKVTRYMYHTGQRDGTVQLCECESALGIRYWEVHRVDQGGAHWINE